MTKQDAISAMREGKKVRHIYFLDDEWATMKDETIILEDGVKCSPYEFWNIRVGEMWEDNWSILN